MADLSELAMRIDRMSPGTAASSEDEQLMAEIEDALAEGYIRALRGDAQSRQLGIRLERLVEIVDEPGAAGEIRRIALQRRTLDRGISDLRAELAVIGEHFRRLGGGHGARR